MKKSTAGTSLPRLAWSNLGRNKRRSIFIVISLTLCVVLLNCVGIAADSVDIEKQVSYTIRTDYVVVNSASTNGMEGFTLREQALPNDVMEAINTQPGVTEASAVYKNTLDDANITYGFPMKVVSTEEAAETGVPFVITDMGLNFNLGADGRPICNVYGMEETALSRMDIQEGETDAHALYEQMENGAGVLLGVQADRSTMKIDGNLDPLEIGDVITVYKDGKAIMELPVLAKAAINGDDQETGYTANGPYTVGADGLFLYLTSSIYEKIYDEPSIYKYSFNVDENERTNMTVFLENYITQVDTSLNYLSADSARENAQATRTMLQFVGGLIGIIFGVAGVLNLTNTIITTILARRHEFATMQSIGMTTKQLTQMMIWEGVYYAIGACIVGLILSMVLAFTVVRVLTGSIWYFTFHFTLLPAIIPCVVLLIVAAIVPVIALKVFNKGSIVEKLRVAE